MKGLYAIADEAWNPLPSLPLLVQQFLRGGVRIIQLRMKHSLKEERARAAFDIAALKQHDDFCFIINDDAELALEVGADGVHVGKGDASIETIRALAGGRLLIGYSSHSLEEALESEEQGADYIAFGAIFPTPTKGAGHPVQGLRRLRAVRAAVKLPLVAIGGITESNLHSVLATGADAVAMISGLVRDQKNIAVRTAEIVELLK